MDKNKIKEMYSKMILIRKYEEAIAKNIEKNEIKTPCHLCIGQEAIAVGVCLNLKKEDYVFSNFRGHGHYLAKGGDGKKMMAEIYCKSTGCSGGRGGSMHLVAPEIGILGNSAIVSGQISLGAGTAMKSKLLNEKNVTIIFLGDAATEEGVFIETINFAVLKKLPVIFVCENNEFAAHMHLKDRQPMTKMSLKTECYLPSFTIDGNDVIKVYNTTKDAIKKARDGNGPTFIECITYRWKGHVGPKLDIEKRIRSEEEVNYWINKCPIKKIKNQIIEQKLIEQSEIEKIEKSIEIEIFDAIEFAKRSSKPNPKTLLNHVFKKEVKNG